MKTSLVVAIALVASGAAMALLRRPASPPPTPAASASSVASMPQPRQGRWGAATAPSADAPADPASPAERPSRWTMAAGRRSLPPGSSLRLTQPMAEPSPPDDSSQILPMAREALLFVGVDEEANNFWAAAVNDSTLPVEERSNLIKNLNEAGFSDPDHLTSIDLPLIEGRLDLIEAMAFETLDESNATAFETAYADLTRMRDRLQPQAATERGSQFTIR